MFKAKILTRRHTPKYNIYRYDSNENDFLKVLKLNNYALEGCRDLTNFHNHFYAQPSNLLMNNFLANQRKAQNYSNISNYKTA